MNLGTKFFILLCMVFFHIVDDYYLQGWLASAKQREWWKNNSPDEKYKYDYLVALFMHSFSWAFMIMIIPSVVAFKFYPVLFITNLLCHAYVDNEKANKHTINLVQDQCIHILQIIVTWVSIFILK